MKARLLLSLFLAFCLLMTGCELIFGPTYTITYNANGATAGSVPTDSDTYHKGDSYTLMEEGTLVRSGYYFYGWSLSASGLGTVCNPGDILKMGSNDMTWYAIWRVVPYTGLSGSPVSLAKYNGRYMYSIVTATPSAKPEANNAPTTQYAFNIATTKAGVANISPAESSRNAALANRDSTISPQARKDIVNRETENQFLASGARQVSRKEASITKAAPASISVGTAWNDVIISDAVGDLWSIHTTCRYISSHAYFFVDNVDTAAMASFLVDYGTAFDAIYHVNHTKFGVENDVDANGKIIIVFSNVVSNGGSTLGYFWSVDKFPNTAQNPYSNEGDIFYLSTKAEYQIDHDDTMFGTLAHEFQHMIYFDEHYNHGAGGTFAWLNEALSQIAEYFNGYLANHLSWIKEFLLDYGSELSLTHWTSNNYGYGAIFMRYLFDRFGETAIKNMCSTNLVGIDAVETATGEDFNSIFIDFSRAVAMSGTGDSTDPKYEFTTLNVTEVQPAGRGGLIPWDTVSDFDAGESFNYWVYPYSLEFWKWYGSFGTMALTGTSIAGTAFGLSR